MNRSKQRGTRFETGLVRYARRVLRDERPHRAALAGAADEGDVRGLWAHGRKLIAECKNVAAQRPSLLALWRAQTLDERRNADADAALLVIHRPGCDQTGGTPSFGRNWCEVTMRDLLLVAGLPLPDGDDLREAMDLTWVRITIHDALTLMRDGITTEGRHDG